MKRRTFIQTTATAALAGSLSTSQATTAPAGKTFIHHVFFWLNNPESTDDFNQLIAALKKLGEVPAIASFHIGIPANTNRDVIERGYQVSWCLFFNTPAEQDVYQTHPIHLQFVEENKHLWKKVVVFDSIDI